jgi:hypothetical protein
VVVSKPSTCSELHVSDSQDAEEADRTADLCFEQADLREAKMTQAVFALYRLPMTDPLPHVAGGTSSRLDGPLGHGRAGAER